MRPNTQHMIALQDLADSLGPRPPADRAGRGARHARSDGKRLGDGSRADRPVSAQEVQKRGMPVRWLRPQGLKPKKAAYMDNQGEAVVPFAKTSPYLCGLASRADRLPLLLQTECPLE